MKWWPALLLALVACAPRATPAATPTGPREVIAVASLASPQPAGSLEKILLEEIKQHPTLNARLEVIAPERLREALGGPPPQQWNAGLFEQLERELGAKLFLSGSVALGETARQARLRLARRDGLVGSFDGETTIVLGLIPYRQPAQPEDAREVIRLALERLAAGLNTNR